MGNKLCKKKSDVVDNSQNVNNNNRSPSKFDRIINRLHLKPATWKSESHLNKKEANRSKSEEIKHGESIFYTQPLSKSSDWINVDLEVPLRDDEHIHLRNPKLSLIFDNDKGTPTPPPRKQQKGTNFREKIEKIARNSLQAIQGDNNNQNKVPVDEPLIVKRQINYNCPLCDSDAKNHNRDHHHQHKNAKKQDKTTNDPLKIDKNGSLKKSKNSKRKKNLSVVSLPNYTDLKLSVADSDSLDDKSTSRTDLNSSRLSLQNPGSKKLTASQSTGKLDTYMTRCRSFGSILPQQLKKFMPQKPNKPVDITSDESFGPLEDWDLGLIEHYNPKDASLPRPRKSLPPKPPNNSSVLSDIESLIVKEEDVELRKPKAPGRKVESLVKKLNKESVKNSPVVKKQPGEGCSTPPPSPVTDRKELESKLFGKTSSSDQQVGTKLRQSCEGAAKIDETSQRMPNVAINNNRRNEKSISTVATPSENLQSNAKIEEKDPVEHSSLMRILQEFSIKDKQQEKTCNVGNDSDFSSLTPSLVEFEKNLNTSLVEDFINAEKGHTRAVYS